MIKKYPEKPYKYPVEIELSSKCNFKCVGCIHKILPDRGKDLTLENFKKIVNFIKENKENVEHIGLNGIGEPLLNLNIIEILDYLKNIKDIPILLPTKGGKLLNDKIIEKIQELRKIGMDINVQFCLYSMRKDILNDICGVEYYDDFFRMIKKLKLLNFDFTSELLLTKYTINEVSYYKKFCNSIGIDPIIHRLHNFGGKLETYDELYVKGITHPIKNINGICGFKPFFDWNANIFPGTFCNHYPLGNLDDFNFSGGMIKIIDKCYDTIDLNNSFCAKCDDNILNLSK